MTAPVQPDAITEAALNAAVAKAIAERDTGEHGYLVSRGYLDEDDVRGLITAAAPIIAAAERERCVAIVLAEVECRQGDSEVKWHQRLALNAVARKLDPVTPEQAAQALEAHHAAAIARAGTSGVDRG